MNETLRSCLVCKNKNLWSFHTIFDSSVSTFFPLFFNTNPLAAPPTSVCSGLFWYNQIPYAFEVEKIFAFPLLNFQSLLPSLCASSRLVADSTQLSQLMSPSCHARRRYSPVPCTINCCTSSLSGVSRKNRQPSIAVATCLAGSWKVLHPSYRCHYSILRRNAADTFPFFSFLFIPLFCYGHVCASVLVLRWIVRFFYCLYLLRCASWRGTQLSSADLLWRMKCDLVFKQLSYICCCSCYLHVFFFFLLLFLPYLNIYFHTSFQLFRWWSQWCGNLS